MKVSTNLWCYRKKLYTEISELCLGTKICAGIHLTHVVGQPKARFVEILTVLIDLLHRKFVQMLWDMVVFIQCAVFTMKIPHKTTVKQEYSENSDVLR